MTVRSCRACTVAYEADEENFLAVMAQADRISARNSRSWIYQPWLIYN